MRYAAYFVAVLVAAAIVVFLARDPAGGAAGSQVASSQPAEPTIDAEPVVTGEKSQLVVHVPNMHCPFACYPAVKETLQDQQGVAGIELVEQKEEGVIDNPRVIVTVGENFDPTAALNALSQAGFSESNVEDAKG